ncbi:MAG TPA: fumarylacetoacetate hydrolase family protein [Alphaproteobacteria bacterium]|nr:fumarylacetoacetate hydrolase family protein [Alphaproteobacteria bacterium]
MDTQVEAAAQHLLAAHRARSRYAALPGALRPTTLASAYAIQEHFRRLLEPERGAVCGYKIALTSPVMQKLCGIPHPLSGPLYARSTHAGPALLDTAAFVRLGLECEIAVRLGDDLRPSDAPFTRQRARAAVAAAAPAFELIDDRNADYAALDAIGIVADNCWNAGIVLGAFRPLESLPDLGSLSGGLTFDGALQGEGRGSDVLGHPLDAVAWLADHLAGRGRFLAAGMIVMTGSIVATKFPRAGVNAKFALDGIGTVEARLV